MKKLLLSLGAVAAVAAPVATVVACGKQTSGHSPIEWTKDHANKYNKIVLNLFVNAESTSNTKDSAVQQLTAMKTDIKADAVVEINSSEGSYKTTWTDFKTHSVAPTELKLDDIQDDTSKANQKALYTALQALA